MGYRGLLRLAYGGRGAFRLRACCLSFPLVALACCTVFFCVNFAGGFRSVKLKKKKMDCRGLAAKFSRHWATVWRALTLELGLGFLLRILVAEFLFIVLICDCCGY